MFSLSRGKEEDSVICVEVFIYFGIESANAWMNVL